MSKSRAKAKSSARAEHNHLPLRPRLGKVGAPKTRTRAPEDVSSCCVLITGFGAFARARFNPTGHLVDNLARIRRPALAKARIVTHVFPTCYAAVDRKLPALIRRHRPDVILMLGLAPRSSHLRIETQAEMRCPFWPQMRKALLRVIVQSGRACSSTAGPVRPLRACLLRCGASTCAQDFHATPAPTCAITFIGAHWNMLNARASRPWCSSCTYHKSEIMVRVHQTPNAHRSLGLQPRCNRCWPS